MSIQLDVQVAAKQAEIPSAEDFQKWADKVQVPGSQTSVCLRIVDEPEAREINKRFRNIDKATNVLSFPAEIPLEHELNLLGDIVICAPVVNHEAIEQKKSSAAHWAHLLIHGILHLQGYQHETDEQAEEMEGLEVKLLRELGIANPYQT